MYKNDSSNQEWDYTNAWGALFLVLENDTPFLILKDVSTRDTLWESELYQDVKFEKLSKHFCSFEGDNCMWGFSFAEKSDANQFAATVKQWTGSKGKGDKTANKTKGKTGGGGFFSSLKSSISNAFGGNEADKKKQSVVIGGPTNFNRSMHIGFDPEKGFVYEKIPQEWKDMFSQVGIGKDELQDKETAEAVFKTLKKFQKKQERKEAPAPPKPRSGPSKRGPPPPPSGSRGAPPPPSSSGGVPPPPPPGAPPPPPPAPSLDSNKLSSITKGSAPPPQEGRDALLEQIRSRPQLKKVDKTEEKTVNLDLSNLSNDGKGDLMSMLQKTLAKRAKDIHSSGSETDSDWSNEDEDW